MPARKNQYISLNAARPGHHPVSPSGNLLRRFTSRTAVAKQLPVRPLLADLGSGATLVLTVVPFDEVPIDFGHSSEAGQFAGPGRAPQGTGEHLAKGQSFQPLPKPLGVALTALRQW